MDLSITPLISKTPLLLQFSPVIDEEEIIGGISNKLFGSEKSFKKPCNISWSVLEADDKFGSSVGAFIKEDEFYGNF